MKTIYLLRHGKSDWDSHADDHERPLAPRGVDAAKRIGHYLTARWHGVRVSLPYYIPLPFALGTFDGPTH